MYYMFLIKIKNLIFDLIFPRHCVICDDVLTFGNSMENKYICNTCKGKLEFIKEPTCKKCGAMINDKDEVYCIKCKKNIFNSFEYGFGLLRYNEYVKSSLHKIKYNGKKEYLEFYGKCMAKAFKERIEKINPDCFIPVPIHKKRLIQRNYNQASVLANIVSNELKKYNIDIPVYDNLIFRTKNTLALNKFDENDRKEQLKNSFALNRFNNVKKVIIVDDILTTGSTIDAMANMLKSSGVEKVYFMVIAVVDNI